MNEVRRLSTVRVKRENLELVLKHSDVIYNLFSLRITNLTEADKSDSTFVYVVLDCAEESDNKSRIGVHELQNYVNKLCSRDSDVKEESDETSHGEEDSSYDSDFEGEEPKSHRDVSRTVSDTLAAEFSEYVSRPPSESYCSQYAAKVEFGLKLGYTEQNVQSALGKLGPNPSQNELLAELIQLGARSPRSPEPEGILSDDAAIEPTASGLRPIVVDGSNVAMAHGNKEVFSCKGIKICVDWFRTRGHNDITVFVPKWRKEASRPDNLIADQEILTELERERIVVFTPSRLVGGKRTICYDDRYILRLAVEVDGIVVSNDNYRDLAQESPEFKKVVEERTLMYSFVNDRFMPPDDPLGRSGPTLDNFLRIQSKRSDPVPHCPYGKKCTYGNKCKYHHPERGSQPHKSVTERLFEHAQKHWQARGTKDFVGTQIKGKSLSVPLGGDDVSKQQHSHLGFSKKTPLTRTKSGNPSCLNHFNIGSGSDRVGKSKSVDNIFSEKTGAHGTRPVSNSSWKTVSCPSTDRQHSHRPVQGGIHKNLGQRLSDPMPSSPDVPGNIHRKLERQLTLNPYEWPMAALQGRSSSGRERPVVEAAHWDHQNVARIASAPESCLPASAQSHAHRLSSSSDPHINLCVADAPARPDAFESPSRWVATNASLVYPTAVPLRLAPTCVPQPQLQTEVYSKGEARRKLHYHLSAIFPEEHVRAALQLYPEETKPQEICAAILAMFPSDQ